MANYNYFTLKDVENAVACCERHGDAVIKTSHGDVIRLSRFANSSEFIAVDTDGSHSVCSDKADLINCCFVRDNVRLKYYDADENGNYVTRWYRYWDLVRVNNPRHPYYLCLVDKESGKVVMGCVGFNVSKR